MKFILDNGHGLNTPGKCSPKWPDMPQLSEWRYTRMLVEKISERLKKEGIICARLVTEHNDIPIWERTLRANKQAQAFGINKTLLISIHVNASNNGTASGWEVHTCKGQTMSDIFATYFWNEAKAQLPQSCTMRGNHSDGDPDWDSNFGLLSNTICPAILTENLFMDNPHDCRYLLSDQGLTTLANIHTQAILTINNHFK